MQKGRKGAWDACTFTAVGVCVWLRYKLLYTFRSQLSDDNSYNCVYQKQDESGHSRSLNILVSTICSGGVALSKDRSDMRDDWLGRLAATARGHCESCRPGFAPELRPGPR